MKWKCLLLSLVSFSILPFGFAQGGYSGYDDQYYEDDRDTYYEDDRDDYRDDDYYRKKSRKIQVALILDVSGSMDGLIEQAKSQLWHIVNGIMAEEDYYNPPVLELALYEYGSGRLGSRKRYLRRVVPLTTDLDWIADELYQLRVGGKYEHGPAAIAHAVNNLQWSRRNRDIKMIFIAGNESLQQGPVHFSQAVELAARKDIIVNTIFCGPYNQGVKMGWKKVARLGGGDYLNIDHNYQPYVPTTSMDPYLMELNTQLNQTYIPYGTYGKRYFQRQRYQDQCALRYGQGIQVQRILTKSSGVYRNPSWDLVDAVHYGAVDLATIPPADLPANMRNMNLAQRRAYIARMQTQRQSVRNRIQTSAKKRDRQLGNEVSVGQRPQMQQPAKARTLDKAILESTKKQVRTRSATPRKPVSAQPQTPQRSRYQTPAAKPNSASRSPRQVASPARSSSRSSQEARSESKSRQVRTPSSVSSRSTKSSSVSSRSTKSSSASSRSTRGSSTSSRSTKPSSASSRSTSPSSRAPRKVSTASPSSSEAASSSKSRSASSETKAETEATSHPRSAQETGKGTRKPSTSSRSLPSKRSRN
ncbi:MAG: VWA domain-containing protein [Bacteroidota bacterium]